MKSRYPLHPKLRTTSICPTQVKLCEKTLKISAHSVTNRLRAAPFGLSSILAVQEGLGSFCLPNAGAPAASCPGRARRLSLAHLCHVNQEAGCQRRALGALGAAVRIPLGVQLYMSAESSVQRMNTAKAVMERATRPTAWSRGWGPVPRRPSSQDSGHRERTRKHLTLHGVSASGSARGPLSLSSTVRGRAASAAEKAWHSPRSRVWMRKASCSPDCSCARWRRQVRATRSLLADPAETGAWRGHRPG